MIIILFLAVLIIGGANSSLAAERNIYEIVAVNNASKVTTAFLVYAETERDAKENVALNGWKVLSIRQVTYRQSSAIPVQVGDDSPIIYLQADNASESVPRLSDEDIIDSLLGSSSPNASVDAEAPSVIPLDALSLTPDSDLLEYLHTIYFHFSITTPTMTQTDNETLAKLPKEGIYYLFGHTDNVSVAPNQLFKDNYDLSFKRAEAVKEIMKENGINPAKLITIGVGALYPAVENRSAADGTLQNRRVEIYGLRTAK